MTDIALESTANRPANPRRTSGRTSFALSMGVLAAAASTLIGPGGASPTADVTASASTATTGNAQTATPDASSQTATLDLSARAAAAGRTSRSSSRESVRDSASESTSEESGTDEPEVVGKRYSTVPLNVRTAPDADADVVTVLDAGSTVRITEETEDSWRQIVYKGKARWVNGEFLSKRKPAESESDGLSTRACASGSGVEKGLKANAIAVHRAVCARFPQVTSYGGYRSDPGSNHNSGRALDIMVTGSRGDDIARWLRSNASELGITELIWEQEIWTTQRAGDGWRDMSDRGSATANHYDHVHVSVK